MNEEKVIQLLNSGNFRAVERVLYDQYANAMYRLCYRYLNHHENTEDVLTNGFIKIFDNLFRFSYRGKGSLEKWMRTIMINECLMEIRKKKLYEPVKEHHFLSEESVEDQMNAEDIYKVIAQLPLGFRTVFNLYVIEGYTHEEIAEQLNISTGTSKSQLSRARTTLKETIKKYRML